MVLHYQLRNQALLCSEIVSKLWNELIKTHDGRAILPQLRSTTLGVRAVSTEWNWLKGLLQEPGYWNKGALRDAVILSGCVFQDQMLFEDEDAYRLVLWNLCCEPEPNWQFIERMLEPADRRPPSLRHADRDVLMPAPEECRARLSQWCDDVLEELAEDYDRAAEIEAPQLARLTDPRAVVTDVYADQRFRRAPVITGRRFTGPTTGSR